MSITGALSNAASGLTASARAVRVVSSNIANVMTEGYAARQLDLTSSNLGGVGTGVHVLGVSRQVDSVLLGLHRDAGANAEQSSAAVAFWQSLEGAFGLPGEGVSKALSGFESALIAATERPDLDSRLSKVASTAEALSLALGAVEDTVQDQRTKADTAIARDVEALNSGLARVDTLNSEVVRLRAAGQSSLGLEDERQALITSLSEIVPMRDYLRSDGRVTLFSAGGQLMLDIDPQEVGFSPSVVVDASMTNGAGLSGLTIGNRAVETGPNGPLVGGRLFANFELRDTASVAAQDAVDTLAADLISRFQDAATDVTLAPGQAGLFTDAGAAITGTPPAGLAGRLALNTAVVPDAGGDLWRIRDGLGATTPGPVGDATQIRNLISAIERPVSAAPGAPLVSFSSSLNEAATGISLQRYTAEDIAAQNNAHHGELTQQMLAQGVDTDAEMQRLLTIEQAYAANARVIETADAMLRRLLEI